MGRRDHMVVVALALGLGLTSARADELVWKLESATCRYDAEVTRPTPEPNPAPVIAPLVLLAQSDFEAGRRPKRAIEGPGDLVWYYSLALPAGNVNDKGVEVTFEEAHVLSGARVTLKARGVHQAKARGKKATVRTTVTFAPDVAYAHKVGQLVIDRVFSTKDGRLESAQFQLDLDTETQAAGTPPPPPVVTHGTWRGRIFPKDELRPDERSFHQQVQGAIDKGVAFLKRGTNTRMSALGTNPGSFQALGEMALPTFALLRSGVPVSEVEPYFEWMERQPFKAVYSVSLYLMVLEARSIQRTNIPPQGRSRSIARYDRKPPGANDVARMRQALAWLLDARKAKEGWWSYGGKPEERVPPPPPSRDGTTTEPPRPPAAGPIGHDGATPATGGDRSNSQFAILALHSAMAAGLDVPPEVWEEVLAELLGAQQASGPAVDLADNIFSGSSPLGYDKRDLAPGTTGERPIGGLPTEERGAGKARGWSYGMKARCEDGPAAYGSMSAAGLSSVAIAREGLAHSRRLTGERDKNALVAMRDGLAWFALNFDSARNVGRGASWYYYYLYSVEKAMDLAGVERVGSHEWWREGAAELLVRQRPDGSWEGDVNETSLALLFLNRATLPAKLDIGEVERVATGAGADPSAWDKVTVPGVGVVSLRQVLQALVSAGAAETKDRLELAQKGLEVFDEVERPRLLPELVQLLTHPQRNVAAWAKQTCKAVAGTDAPADIDAFSQRWDVLRAAWETLDAGKIATAQGILTEAAASVPLKRAALTCLARLRATETLGEVIALLDHRDGGLRTYAHQTLVTMAGPRREYDPAAQGPARKKQVDAWRAWWQQEGPALVREERIRKAVADLGVEARAAKAVQDLRAIGKPAVRALIDGLRPETSRERAHSLLKELTGQTLPADAGEWIEWWEKQGGG